MEPVISTSLRMLLWVIGPLRSLFFRSAQHHLRCRAKKGSGSPFGKPPEMGRVGVPGRPPLEPGFRFGWGGQIAPEGRSLAEFVPTGRERQGGNDRAGTTGRGVEILWINSDETLKNPLFLALRV